MAFNLKMYWENRYVSGRNSGEGSYGKEAQFKAAYINEMIESTGAKSIVEIGCGDGNNLKLYEGFKSYCGYDISKTAIDLCKRIHPYDFTTDPTKIPKGADICLCLDVLFHQVNDDDYFTTLDMMFKVLKPKYIIIYSTSHEDNQGMALHMRNRDFYTDIKTKYPEWIVTDTTEGLYSKQFVTYMNYETYKK